MVIKQQLQVTSFASSVGGNEEGNLVVALELSLARSGSQYRVEPSLARSGGQYRE